MNKKTTIDGMTEPQFVEAAVRSVEEHDINDRAEANRLYDVEHKTLSAKDAERVDEEIFERLDDDALGGGTP